MAPISTVSSSSMSEDWSELPIRQRGLFLHDHFFRDSRAHFQQALDKVLHDWEDQQLSDWHSNKLTDWDEDIFSDRLNRYRMLKKDHMKTDSQAVTVIINEHHCKIIIDVREFMQGCLKISIVGDQELLVEGSIEDTISGVKGKRTLDKRFLLPSEAIISDTTSALSSDGILTIISPKKVVQREIKECKKEASSKHHMNQNKRTVVNQKNSTFSDDFIDEFLPISRRGHFFSDSIFKDAHHDYNRAVRDVLERWNENSEDDFASYRNLRRRALKEENQAVTEKENHQVYKIVIDVHDFVTDGEVSVKVVNDKYLEVQGCIDQEEEQTKCKKNFKRKFTLPKNTDVKNISSLLSSDGVLTITSPKMVEEIDFKETIIPVKLEKFLKKDSSDSTLETEINKSSLKNQNEATSVVAKECITEIKSDAELEKSKEMKTNVNNEVIIPVTLDEDYDNMEHQCIKSTQQLASTESGSSQDLINVGENEEEILCEVSASNKEISSEKCIENNFAKQDINTINEDGYTSSDTESDLSEATSEVSCISPHHFTLSNASSQLENATSHQEHTNINSSSPKVSGNEYIIPVNIEMGVEVLNNDSNTNREVKVEEQIYKQDNDVESDGITIEYEKTACSKVPIVRRGPFFIDSFFNESHKQFEKAVQNVLHQSGFTSKENDLEFYRSLRQRSNSEQNQANGWTEDDTSFKIVVDVQDFKNGDIKIKVHNSNELTVQGEQNQKQNHTLFRRKFCRKFIFPSHINCDAVTSAVSEDGILTINAQKKIKENCEAARPDESVKSILISCESNNGINNSNEKYCKSEDNNDSLCIADNHNIETKKSVDNSKHNVVEDAQTLPITRRGSFFTDPFFEDNHLVFKNTIRDIIDKSGFISKDDDFSFYRSMLERSTNKENQAATITESDKIYKIVLDIQGFSAEEIKTKFLSSTDLVIEATTEQKEEGSSSTRNFRRCFVFQNSVNVDGVTSSLSSDGILTISAPKKILDEEKEDGSYSKDVRKHIRLNNGWEDEKTHQTSSERDGVISKTFSKSKSSYQHVTKAP